MTKEELAARLNGREYRNEIAKDEERIAKESGLVVLFGASDDLAEFRGAIRDEAGIYDGGDIVLVTDPADGSLKVWQFDVCTCIYSQKADALAKAVGLTIRAVWCADNGYDWSYETEIPHATFDVMESGEKYCRGIVFALADV